MRPVVAIALALLLVVAASPRDAEALSCVKTTKEWSERKADRTVEALVVEELGPENPRTLEVRDEIEGARGDAVTIAASPGGLSYLGFLPGMKVGDAARLYLEDARRGAGGYELLLCARHRKLPEARAAELRELGSASTAPESGSSAGGGVPAWSLAAAGAALLAFAGGLAVRAGRG